MLNRVCLVGRLTRNPELKRTSNGTAVATFNLAVNRNFKTDNQEADFISCVVWRKAAENVDQYCSKGSLVSVDGRVQTRSYDNNQGQRVYITEVVADSVQFLETRGQRERNQNNAPVTASQNNASFADHTDTHDDFNESIDSYDIMDEDIQF